MKRISFLFLLSLFFLYVPGCGSSSLKKAPAMVKEQPAADRFKSPATSVPSEETDPYFFSPELNVLEGIAVEQTDSETELNIPADFLGPVTQEDLTQIASDAGYPYAALHEDGSVTLRMSKTQHLELMKGMADFISERLEHMTASEEYPTFREIHANGDFTEFTVVLSSSELKTSDSFSTMTFFMYGKMYAAFSGTEPGTVYVQYISGDSGEVIGSFDSSNMQEQ